MELSGPLGIQALSRKYRYRSCFGVLSHIINPLLTEQEDGWILASFFFCVFMESTLSRSINREKKTLANIQPS